MAGFPGFYPISFDFLNLLKFDGYFSSTISWSAGKLFLFFSNDLWPEFYGVFSILNFLWIVYSWGVYSAFGGLTRHVWKSCEMSSAEGYKRRSHNGIITDYRLTWWSRLIDLRVEIRLQGRVRRRYCRYRRRPRRRRRRRRRRFKGIWIRRGMSCPMTRFE